MGPIGSWDRFNQSLANNPPVVVGDERDGQIVLPTGDLLDYYP